MMPILVRLRKEFCNLVAKQREHLNASDMWKTAWRPVTGECGISESESVEYERLHLTDLRCFDMSQEADNLRQLNWGYLSVIR